MTERTSTRRRLLAALGSLAAGGALAGCATDVNYPEDRSGSPDLVLKNCNDRPHTVALTVTEVASGETVHDHSHEVPDEYCSDMGPSYNVYGVWTDEPEYRVRATGDDLAGDEATVSLSETELDEVGGTRWIRIDDGEIDIYE